MKEVTTKTLPIAWMDGAFTILIFRELWKSEITLNDLKDFIDADALAEKFKNYPMPRECKACGKGMKEGFLFEEICETFCSEECLHTEVTPDEYQFYYENNMAYWTDWEYEFTEEDQSKRTWGAINLF